jgi:UDP-glucose 4-epimerase
MSLKNRSVLITGGAGFIGSHLVDSLIREEPESIVVVDNFFLGKEANLERARANFAELKVYKQDASDYEEMKKIIQEEGVDVIFDLAVIPLPASLIKPRWSFEQNVNIALTICELAREDLFYRLVHFSSSEAYGTSEYAPMDEKHPLNGTTPYAASKAACDQLILSYCRTFGIDASIIRPFNNYGPRQNEGSYAGVVPLTIKRILNNEQPIIYGNGYQTRDYLYVTDTAKAAIDTYNSKNSRSKVLNIASGKEISIRNIITMICEYMGYAESIVYKEERPGDVRRHIANIFLAEDLIGFKPIVAFEDGLKETVDWYVQNIKADKK